MSLPIRSLHATIRIPPPVPIYRLTNALLFPDPERASPQGILAVGGDLSIDRLVFAYRQGIFPWYGPGEPILWWSPPRRCVLQPADFHISRSLRRQLRRRRCTVTFDRAFAQVIQACADTRLQQGEETWITSEMIDAYCALHVAGFAHSAETWQQGNLVGGIYGVSLGRAFFGESMFARESNASKLAFATLAHRLHEWQFTLIDCQITNPHLVRLGATEITRAEFLLRLADALRFPTRQGQWS